MNIIAVEGLPIKEHKEEKIPAKGIKLELARNVYSLLAVFCAEEHVSLQEALEMAVRSFVSKKEADVA